MYYWHEGEELHREIIFTWLAKSCYRRLRGDLIETYKITHKIYDPNITNSLINLAHTNTRSHKFNF